MLIEKIFNIKNKVVVVSGASGFIGGEISCLLAEAGCTVALLYNNNRPNDQIIKRIIDSKNNSAIVLFKIIGFAVSKYYSHNI